MEIGFGCICKESATNYFESSVLYGCSKFSVFLWLPHFFGAHGFLFQTTSDFSGFRYLRTCFLSDVYIIDDMLERLVEKCPLLENLRVGSCTMGLNTLKISSQSLKYFNFSGNRHKITLTLTVNCLKLVNVTIHNSMLSLELNSCGDLNFSTTGLNVLEGLSNRNSLRKLPFLDGVFTCLLSQYLAIFPISKNSPWKAILLRQQVQLQEAWPSHYWQISRKCI